MKNTQCIIFAKISYSFHIWTAFCAWKGVKRLIAATEKKKYTNQSATKLGIVIYECEHDEAVLFQTLASQAGVKAIITDKAISEANTELAIGNSCVSVSHKTKVTHSILRALARNGVRYICTRSAGLNHIDVDFAKRIGLTVGNVAYSPDSVADYTVMLMLMMIRNATQIISRAHTRDFRLDGLRGKELRDMTVGVVGTGRIGAAVIARLQPFGCQIVAYDHRPKISAQYVSLDELLRQSDIVTLHTPLNAETHHLLDRQHLSRMKHGSYVVNTGRGSLIDTQALTEALENGGLGGAALDVLEGEEGLFYADYRNRDVENRLLLRLQNMPNVIMTPHAAYYTDHAIVDIVKNTLMHCIDFKKEIV